jgi:hypothetical protein
MTSRIRQMEEKRAVPRRVDFRAGGRFWGRCVDFTKESNHNQSNQTQLSRTSPGAVLDGTLILRGRTLGAHSTLSSLSTLLSCLNAITMSDRNCCAQQTGMH